MGNGELVINGSLLPTADPLCWISVSSVNRRSSSIYSCLVRIQARREGMPFFFKKKMMLTTNSIVCYVIRPALKVIFFFRKENPAHKLTEATFRWLKPLFNQLTNWSIKRCGTAKKSKQATGDLICSQWNNGIPAGAICKDLTEERLHAIAATSMPLFYS